MVKEIARKGETSRSKAGWLPPSALAAHLIYCILRVAGDTIHLAHVIADPRTPSTAVGSSTAATQWSPARDERLYASEFFSRMEHEAHTMLESRFIPSLQFTGINYEVNLLRLKVHKSAAGIAEALANCARDVNADLLIIISHGAGVLADYGSVARWCSEHSTVPALLLPPDVIKSGPGGPPSNTVLVAASDDMAGLKSAFDFAMKGLTRPGDNVYIMHAKAVADEEAAVAARKELVANVLRWQGASAEPHAATLNIACDLVTEPACEQSTMAATATSESMAGGLTPLASPAAERLCVYASDLNARAVVLSHHGRSMAREMMFGPLTQHCTKFCSRPLVVLNETG